MTKQEIKLKKKIESELRNKEFAKNKDSFRTIYLPGAPRPLKGWETLV